MSHSRPRSRSLFSLVVAGVVLGVFTLSPVAAHFNRNTKHLGRHAWKQVIKKKVFTRRQANRRFQRSCDRGAIIAFAHVDVSRTTSGGFTSRGVGPAFNCAGGPITVLRAANYLVKIPGVTTGPGGSHLIAATVTANDGVCSASLGCSPSNTTSTVVGDESIDFFVVRSYGDDGNPADADFTLVVYSP